MVTPGQILRDDDMRPVKVLSMVKDCQGCKVLLERQDKRPREHRKVWRWHQEVAHYPDWRKP